MMVMTAKVDFKKLAIGLIAAIGVIVAAIILLGGGKDAQTTAVNLSGNEARVQFLTDLGWEVSNAPTESGQVRIPREQSQVYQRYNAIQQAQGYDLSQYAGKEVMRYVYQVNNYPNATEPVYATLLVYKNQVIGGDITDTAAKGMIHGLRKASDSVVPVPETTVVSTPEPTA